MLILRHGYVIQISNHEDNNQIVHSECMALSWELLLGSSTCTGLLLSTDV